MMINNTTSDDEEMMINMLFINILFDVDQEMMVNFSSGHIQLDWKRAEESRSKSTGKSTWLCNMSTCFCFPLHVAKRAGPDLDVMLQVLDGVAALRVLRGGDTQEDEEQQELDDDDDQDLDLVHALAIVDAGWVAHQAAAAWAHCRWVAEFVAVEQVDESQAEHRNARQVLGNAVDEEHDDLAVRRRRAACGLTCFQLGFRAFG